MCVSENDVGGLIIGPFLSDSAASETSVGSLMTWEAVALRGVILPEVTNNTLQRTRRRERKERGSRRAGQEGKSKLKV